MARIRLWSSYLQKPPRCAVCGKFHLTKYHKCNTCNASQQCDHIELSCANCKGNHTANCFNCQVFKNIKAWIIVNHALLTALNSFNIMQIGRILLIILSYKWLLKVLLIYSYSKNLIVQELTIQKGSYMITTPLLSSYYPSAYSIPGQYSN